MKHNPAGSMILLSYLFDDRNEGNHMSTEATKDATQKGIHQTKKNLQQHNLSTGSQQR